MGRPFQFTLRTLFFLTLLAALACVAERQLARERQERREREARLLDIGPGWPSHNGTPPPSWQPSTTDRP